MHELDQLPFLLIEDNEIDVLAFTRGMRKGELQNQLVVAEHGREALEILTGEHAEKKIALPAVIFLDVNMPIMDGHEFLTALRADERLRTSIVFMLTTSDHREDLRRAYEKNVAGYVVKQDVGRGFERLWSLVRSYFEVVTLP